MDSQAILTPTDEAHVFLVEGAHLNHNSIAGLLRLAGLTVHTWPTTTRFLESIPKAAPAALVVNLGNHVSDGLALHAELISRGIRLPVVFLTKPDRAREAVQAVKQGVFDVLFEPTSREELLQAVSEALEKDLNQIRVLARQSRLSAKSSLLSPRESQVHKMMLKGFGNREIAEALAISVATAKQYKSAVMRKSGVRTLAELFEASATLDT